METRTTTRVRVYKLILNNMRMPRIEMGEVAAFSTDYQKLVDWYNSQLAPERWRDGNWIKTFAGGSPLEWYNPASSLDLNDTRPFGHGIKDELITVGDLMIVMKLFRYIG